MSGKLFIVPTPIGNLKDMTLRAIETLRSVDLILAEDTRNSSKLLKHFDIQKPLQSYHAFNEHKITGKIIDKLLSGETIALITDAGTPAISDPGFYLVREAVKNNIPVETLPGPVAFVPALVNSALPSERFIFEGFLPVKKGRKTRLQELANEKRTMVFYESPHRILKTLKQFIEFFGQDRKASLSREISKIHEETIRGTLREIYELLESKPVKGEMVLVVEGKNKK